MDEVKVAAELERMLGAVAYVADRFVIYAASDRGARRLDAFGPGAEGLLAYAPQSTILVPELHLGPAAPGGWPGPITLSAPRAASFAHDHGFERAVLECDDGPYSHPQDWLELRPELIRRIAPGVAGADLDIPFQASQVTYYA